MRTTPPDQAGFGASAPGDSGPNGARPPRVPPSLGDPGVLENPNAHHRALSTAGIWFDPKLGFHVCGSYPMMREILRNTAVFSSVDSQRMDALRPPPPDVSALRQQALPPVNTLVTNDPPSHTRYRALVDDPFRPRSIEALTDRIRAIADDTIDEFIDRGACDAVSDLAIPVPIRVIAELLGLPRELAPDIKRWSDAAVEPLGMMVSDERLLECARQTLEFQACMVDALKARQAIPRDDLLSHLAQARDTEGNPLTMAEMVSLTQQFLVAGNETTTNAIAAGVQLLIDNPAQYQLLQDDPTPDRVRRFANEVLRLEAPVQGLFRIVRQDTEIGGVKLSAGARIMLRFAAANRDAAQYAAPDQLDVERRNTGTHLAFGAGIHHCIGANLAREEMVQTFMALLTRTRDLSFDGDRNDFRHHPSMILRGLKHLYVRFRVG